MGNGLTSLAGQIGIEVEDAVIEVKEGTYDTKAHFDRQKSADSQAEIDRMVEGGEEAMEEAEEIVEEVEEEEGEITANGGNGQVEEGEGGGEVVSQDDIDALIDG